MQPLLLVLDGLDECQSGIGVQQEFVELVAEFALAAKASKLPVVWMVTSRTEWAILSAFSKHQCWKEQLHTNTPEDRQDVSTFLRSGFAKIRDKNRNLFSEGREWPQEEQLSQMTTWTSGLFAIASAFLQFVDKGSLDNPVTRLETGLDRTRDGPRLMFEDTWRVLRSNYWDITEKIPRDIWPVTARILAFLVLVIENDVPAQLLANILFLDQTTFYASLHGLYSVLDIPEPSQASQSSVQFQHESCREHAYQVLSDSPDSNTDMSGLGFRTDLQSFFVRWCDLWGMKCTRKLSTKAFQCQLFVLSVLSRD